jgi:hypothetical protein
MDGDGISEPYLWEKGPSGGGREQRHLNGEVSSGCTNCI